MKITVDQITIKQAEKSLSDGDKLKLYKNFSISLPDLGFAFNPIRLFVENMPQFDGVTIEVAIGVNTEKVKITRQPAPKSDTVSFDLSALAKAMFDRLEFHKVEDKDTTLLKKLNFKIYGENKSQGLTFEYEGSLPVIWGALQIGERYTQNKILSYFPGYPFTLPLYVEKLLHSNPSQEYPDHLQLTDGILLEARRARDIYYDVDGKQQTAKGSEPLFALGGFREGKHNIDLGDNEFYEDITIISTERSEYSIFDYTFNHTFGPEKVWAGHKLQLELTLRPQKCSTEGVYLRWINKFGEYNYYLFQQSTETSTTKFHSIKYSNVYYTTDLSDNYHHGVGKSIGKTIEQSVKLFAHLVDSDTVDLLRHLVESPVVDMFLGYRQKDIPMWVSVDIQEGQFVKSKEHLQDFECFLIPNERQVQTL